MDEAQYLADARTKAAVERQFEIIGEAFNRIKKMDPAQLAGIPDWELIIAFRNIIAYGYDVVDDAIVFRNIRDEVPALVAAVRGKLGQA